MNNLTTRKIVLGMLMALVLAFSVQGTADAEMTTRARRSSSHQDLETRFPGQTFRISFSVSEVVEDDELTVSWNGHPFELTHIRGTDVTDDIGTTKTITLYEDDVQ